MQNPLNFALAGIKEFLLKSVNSSGASVQVWMLLALAIVVILAALVAVSAVKNSKRKISVDEETVASEDTEVEETREEEKEPAVEELAQEEQTEESAEKESEESVVEVQKDEEAEEEEEAAVPAEEPEKEETSAEAEPVEEKTEEPEATEGENVESAEEVSAEEEPAVEELAQEEQTEEPAVEEEPATQEVASDEQAEEKTEEVAATEEEPARKAPAKKTTAAKTAKSTEKSEDKTMTTKSKTKAAPAAPQTIGKFEVCNSSIGGYRYHLLANNGQLLYESRDYKTYKSCEEAITSFVNSVENGEFIVCADKFGNYKYHLKSATSNNIIYIGESYTKKKACENSIESVKRFASVSPIIDSTDADFEVTTTAYEIPADVVKAVENKQGASGKWSIEPVDETNPSGDYEFLLYANNGQLLFESRGFSSYANCRKGLDTFVSTVQNGYFIIDADKFGRYKFFLRSKKAGSQAEYVGPNYPDKTAACNSATSVYKFALLTPVKD